MTVRGTHQEDLPKQCPVRSSSAMITLKRTAVCRKVLQLAGKDIHLRQHNNILILSQRLLESRCGHRFSRYCGIFFFFFKESHSSDSDKCGRSVDNWAGRQSQLRSGTRANVLYEKVLACKQLFRGVKRETKGPARCFQTLCSWRVIECAEDKPGDIRYPSGLRMGG